MKRFFIRLMNWEYWPFSVLYFPVFFYYGWLALKHRSFFFFSSSNPNIEFGGMMGEKKSEIFDLIPGKYLPVTKLVIKGDLEKAIKEANVIGLPLIAKPNVGERGVWVKKIDDEDQLSQYVRECPVDFLLQELVTYPIELGVFYVRKPNQAKGKVTSIVRKRFLKIVGDGNSTVKELLIKNNRALLTADLESEYLRKIGHTIPDMGEEVLVEPIGNHCRGTQFLDDTYQIDEELNQAFDTLAKEIPEFYFGRFDIRCNSYDELKELKKFKILELNGAGAEPGHIYHPGYSLIKAYKDIFWHLGVLADISELNKKRGINFWSFNRGLKKWKEHRQYIRMLTA